MPPATKFTTGSRPFAATSLTSSYGAWRSLAATNSSSSRMPSSRRISREHVAQLADGLDDVAGAGLALGPHHRRALVDPPQRLAEVPAAAHERDLEGVLVDVVGLVGGREDLGLVDVVDAQRLEHLRLDEVADAGLGHDRDGDGGHDPLDHRRVGHARDAAGGADVGRDALERHDGDGAGLLGDLGLLGRDDVHDDAALEHLGEALLGGPGGGFGHGGWGSPGERVSRRPAGWPRGRRPFEPVRSAVTGGLSHGTPGFPKARPGIRRRAR